MDQVKKVKEKLNLKLSISQSLSFINELKSESSVSITDTDSKQNIPLLLKQIEYILLGESSVTDCKLLLRKTKIGDLREAKVLRGAAAAAKQDRELIAYIVAANSFSPKQLHEHLQKYLPESLLPKSYVPVTNLPLTSTGTIDEEKLTSLPIIDSELVQKWEKELESQPEIDRAAVVVQKYTESNSAIHLSDLLSDWQDINSQTIDTTERINKSVSIENSETRKLAICQGKQLHLPADAPKNLTEVLLKTAKQTSTKKIIYIQPDGTETYQSYPELLEKAAKILTGLRQLGLKPKDKVIFQLEQNQDFIEAFWACILGGFVPVPISIASSYEPDNSYAKKLINGWQTLNEERREKGEILPRLLKHPLILTSSNLQGAIATLANQLELENFEIEAIDNLRSYSPTQEYYQAQPDDLALLLLTSGSTGIPKGVMLTHHNIISNVAASAQINNFTQEDISLNWLRLDHVGSLVRCSIRDIYIGSQQIHAPTELFLEAPLKLLDWIEKYRVTFAWAPNFALGLINDRADIIQQRQWDLSSLKSMLSVAEAIVPKTAKRFAQLLTPNGLSAEVMHSAWGMSETCAAVTFSHRYLRELYSDDYPYVEVGVPTPGLGMRIVDREGKVVPEETIGSLEITGAMIVNSYYENPELNREAFTEDGWLKTGDLGYIRQGRLTVTGREKDVIIINGLNHSSHEIEAIVEEIEGIEVSYTAACALRTSGKNTDQLLIFFHTPITEKDRLFKLLKQIQTKIVSQIGIIPAYLIPVDKEIIPKTAIGKIQRSQLVERFQKGEFEEIVKDIDLLLENENTLPDWFYRKIWRRKEAVTLANIFTEGLTLIFLDSVGLGEYLCTELGKQEQSCIKVEMGIEFAQLDRDRYSINPTNPQDYQQLLEAISQKNLPINQILHLWTYDEATGDITSLEDLEKAQEKGIYSLLFLVQALAQVQTNDEKKIRLQVISSNSQPTSATEKIAYQNSTLLGLIKTFPKEISWLDCRHLDLPFESVEINGAAIIKELQVLQDEQEVAYRQRQRFVAALEKLDLIEQDKQQLPFKNGGMYLITGGLGGIGTAIAKYLLEHYQARLLLVGRTALPEQNSWKNHLEKDNKIAERIKTYLSLEQLNGEIVYETVDICAQTQLQQVLTKAENNWQQKLDGVIHLAGVASERQLLEETKDSLANSLRAKVLGTWVLHQLVKNQSEAVFISFSSVLSFFGGSTVGAYSAANNFLDSFAHYQRQQSVKSYCFGSSTWNQIGINRGYQGSDLRRTQGQIPMSIQQGLYSFLAGLQGNIPQLIFGLDGSKRAIQRYTTDNFYPTQILQAYFTTKTVQEISKLEELTISDRFGTLSQCQWQQIEAMPLTETGEIDRQKLITQGLPNSKTKVAPRNELEHILAAIWQEVLEVSIISVEDNFFELGGSSIKAAILINKLQEKLGEIVHVVVLFNAPTIAKLADYLNKNYPEAIALLLGQEINPVVVENTATIDAAKIAQMRQFVRCLSPRQQPMGKKNPPMVFVLSPPRSGSTLFRVMLTGHPQLFAPPELYLLNFNTLQERRETFSGTQKFWLQGNLRALMAIRNCSLEEAEQLMTDWERQALTCQEYYGLLQESLKERILVDKTPTYSIDLETLKRAEKDFANPLYIHLVRHPYGMISSFEEAKLDQLLYNRLETDGELPFNRREIAELIWTIGQQNILDFLQDVPQERQYQVKFEDLVQQPQTVMEGVCQFLGLDFEPAMVQPYQEAEEKMSDGVRSESRMLGDIKFNNYKKIDAQVAEKWREEYKTDFLGDITQQIAQSFGYELIKEQPKAAIKKISQIDKISWASASRWLNKLENCQDQEIDSLWQHLVVETPNKRQILTQLLQANTSESYAYPLSFSQQRMWILYQLEPNSPAYNIGKAIKLRGNLNVEALKQSLAEIINRHETLRTTFKLDDSNGQPVQVIASQGKLDFSEIDLETFPTAQKEAEIARLIKEKIQEPFDLVNGSLFRVTLLRLSANEHFLVLSLHHIISDGWSQGLLSQELSTLYESFSKGLPSSLPELPIQYADYAYWKRQIIHESLEGDITYWQQQLQDAPPSLDLPLDFPRPSVSNLPKATESITLSSVLVTNLNNLSRTYGVTLFITLMTALKILLFKWTKQKDLVVGTVISGRNRPEIQQLIGCFINFLVLRSQASDTQKGEDFLSQVSKTVLEAYTHQDCPFEKIVEAINPERKLGQNPIYNVGFLLQNFPAKPFFGQSLTAEPVNIDTEAALLDLRFVVYESSDELVVDCEYNTEIFNSETISHLLDSYGLVLQKLVEQPKTKLAEFKIKPELESQAEQARARDYKETIAITATFTAEPIQEYLNFWLKKLKFPAQIEFAPYNQVFQQLLDPNSQLSANSDGINIILVNFEDWLKYNSKREQGVRDEDLNPQESISSKIERNVQNLLNSLKSVTQRSSNPHLVCICPASPAFLSIPAQAELVQNMENLLNNELASTNGIYLVTSKELTTIYPVENYYDSQSNELGHIPYTPIYFCALATTIARKLFAIKCATYKVIAIDSDETLWKGVCGEVGAEGIEIDPAREKLQKFLLKQQEAGILLCLCSKNAEEDVIEVFQKRQDMPLKLDRLVSWRINWQAKSENLKSLAEELNLGLDSFIFIDNNPVECAEVRANCPQVLTLQLPQEAEAIEKFINHTWAFDRLKVTAEDKKRTQLYQQNLQRESLRQDYLTFEDFLAGLQLEIEINPPKQEQLTRIAQLTQRTNQFNATTIRRTENEIEKLSQSGELEARAIAVKDRFGDYGLVGLILYKQERDAIVVDTFLLSCRVLGRGVEYKMLAELGKIANNRGLNRVKLPYLPTQKNQPVLDFLQNIGAQFQRQQERSLLFKFPVSFLIQLSYNPEVEEGRGEKGVGRGEKQINATPFQLKSLIFERIAQELSDMGRVLEIINSQQYREIEIKERGFVAPRNSTEKKLAQIWSEILKVKPIGIHDNFFDLGGNSLLAVQLLAKIAKVFRQNLLLSTLLQASTIEQLALNLEQQNLSTHCSSIVPLQSNGSKPPLFLLHPAGATGTSLLIYRELAKSFASDRPVYGVQPQGLNRKTEVLTTVEEMAAYYIKEIQKIQPIGPYLLGGYSFGGKLAFEMARQLDQKSQEVAKLVFIDCRGPNCYRRSPFLQRLKMHFHNLIHKKHEYLLEKMFDWKEWLSYEFGFRTGKMTVKTFQAINLALPMSLQNVYIEQRNWEASSNYQPKFYPGKIILLRANEWLGGIGCEIDEYLGWGHLAGKGVEIYDVPGDHLSLFQHPYVKHLSETLKACLDK